MTIWFWKLYNGGISNEFVNDNYNIAKIDKYTKEINMEEKSHQVNKGIKYYISFQEIFDVVMGAKS